MTQADDATDGNAGGLAPGYLSSVGASASAIASYFTANFLRANNTIKWGALGAAIFGGIALKLQASIISIFVSLQEGIDILAQTYDLAMMNQAEGLAATISSELGRTWQTWDLGLLTLPVNVVTVLAAFGAVVLLTNYLSVMRSSITKLASRWRGS